MMFVNLHAILFDLDGTLCHYDITTADALGATLDSTGLSSNTLGDLHDAAARYLELWHEEEKRNGPPPFRTRIWARLLAEHGIDDSALARRLGEAYIGIRLPTLELDPSAPALLTNLHRRFRLGLLTNGPGEVQWPKIEKLSLRPWFDAITVTGDIGVYKPDPRAFAVILSRLGEVPARAVYVGDSYQTDVIGAKHAGLHCVWVKRPDNNEIMDSVRPDVEIDDLSQLSEIL